MTIYVIKNDKGHYVASRSYIGRTGRTYCKDLQNARTFHYRMTAQSSACENEHVVPLENELEKPE